MKNRVGMGLVLLASFGLNSCSSHQNQTQGYIEGDLTYMASSQAGRLIYLQVARGQTVHAGQVLFTIEPEPRNFALKNSQDSLAQAKATLADLVAPLNRSTQQGSIQAQIQSAEADVAYTQLQLKRNALLVQLDAVQQQALDEASDQAADAMGNLKNLENQLATGNLSARENQIKSAEASVEIAQSSLDQAAWMLGQTIVRAPEDGFVFDNLYWPGEEVPAVTPVITLLSPDHIKVIFYIPEPWLASLTMGENINFTADGLNQIGHAKISYISPSAEYTPPVIYSRDRQDQLVYRIEANFSEPKDALVWHPGQPVTVTIPEAVPEAVKKDIKTGTVQS